MKWLLEIYVATTVQKTYAIVFSECNQNDIVFLEDKSIEYKS